MPRILVITSMAILLGACQVTPEVADLQNRNSVLEKQLSDAQRQIEVLKGQEAELRKQTQELERLTGVLTAEKDSRVRKSSELRSQVREFVQTQIDDLKSFLVKGELLDFVGSALIKRSHSEGEPLALIDLAHPMPRPGALTGVTGVFNAPTDVQLKVLRPMEDEYLVIWESQLLQVAGAGEITVKLPVTVGVEQGDVVAYVFPENTAVNFDKGTGDTRYTTHDLAMGDSIALSSLDGEEEKRAYSLGVYAILD